MCAVTGRIILVHDLLRGSKTREQLERTVTNASLAASSSVGVSFRISAYRFDYERVREEGEFGTALEELLGYVQELIVSHSSLTKPRSNCHRVSGQAETA